jgi:hypothetical protein
MIDASAGVHEGRPQEPPARAGHPPHRRRLQPAARSPRYSRMVAFDEIEKNDFNLNLPRYIDSQTARGPAGHRGPPQGRHPGGRHRRPAALLGRLPRSCGRRCSRRTGRATWISPSTRRRSRPTIYEHPEFVAFIDGMNAHFAEWRQKTAKSSEGSQARVPSQGNSSHAGRGPARALRRQAAHRRLRRLSAPDGLLGRDDAGRLLPDRRRRLEGRDVPRDRDEEGQERQGGKSTRAGPATSCRRRSSWRGTSRRSRRRSTSSRLSLRASPRG